MGRLLIILICILLFTANSTSFQMRFHLLGDTAVQQQIHSMLLERGMKNKGVTLFLKLAKLYNTKYSFIAASRSGWHTAPLQAFLDKNINYGPHIVSGRLAFLYLVQGTIKAERFTREQLWRSRAHFVKAQFYSQSYWNRIPLPRADIQLFKNLFCPVQIPHSKNKQALVKQAALAVAQLWQKEGLSFAGTRHISIIRQFQINNGMAWVHRASLLVEDQGKLLLIEKKHFRCDPYVAVWFDNRQHLYTYLLQDYKYARHNIFITCNGKLVWHR